MKKLISVLILFSIMMLFAVGEIVFTNRFYSEQIDLLDTVSQHMDFDPESIDRDDVVVAMDKAFLHFEKGKKIVMMIGNHNQVKFVDEKLVALKELVRMNQQYDAYVTLNTAKNYIADLKDDVLPKITNLF